MDGLCTTAETQVVVVMGWDLVGVAWALESAAALDLVGVTEILQDHHHVGIDLPARSLQGTLHESVTQPLDYHQDNQTATHMTS